MFDPDYALFARIVDAGSLSGAARELGISPAMISKRLARLEHRLGTQLIRRSTRRMELTALGECFHADLIQIIAATEAAEARLSSRRSEPIGALRISAPTSFGRMHIVPILAKLLDRFPLIEAEIELSDEYVDLLGSRTDVAIRITSTLPRGLVAERLAENRRVLCAAPAYLAQHGIPVTIADLHNHRLLAARGQMPWKLVKDGRSMNVAGHSFVATNSSEAVRELALGGAGVALRSLWDVSGELAEGRLARVLPDYQGSTEVGIFAVRTPTVHITPAVAAFIAELAATLQPVPPWDGGQRERLRSEGR